MVSVSLRTWGTMMTTMGRYPCDQRRWDTWFLGERLFRWVLLASGLMLLTDVGGTRGICKDGALGAFKAGRAGRCDRVGHFRILDFDLLPPYGSGY